MKKLVLMLALLAPVAAFGQVTVGGRASVGVDYKISKGLHAEAEVEVRAADSFAGLGSTRTTLGLTYKPLSFLKVGIGYTNINPFKTNKELSSGSFYTGFWYPRHRLYADMSGTLKAGDFRFSLRERLQFTHNTADSLNIYQSTRNALALKSRLGVKYKGFRHVTPALSVELRHALNDPWGTVSGSAKTTGNTKREYYDYIHTGYTHAYLNRVRVNLGAQIDFNKHHSLEPYVMYDYNRVYEIDTNGMKNWEEDGVRLFTDGTGWAYGSNLIFGLKYVFSF